MKKGISKIISWAIVGLVLFFLIKNLVENWQNLRTYHFQINPLYLLLSSLLFWTGAFIASQVWHFILVKSGLKMPRIKTFKVHFLSRFGSYVPGKIWFILIRMRLAKNESSKTIVAGSLLETVLDLIGPSMLSLLFMGIYFLDGFYLKIILFAITAGFIFILWPRLFYSVLNFGLKKIKKEPIAKEFQLTPKNLCFALLMDLIFWLIWGLGFYFFIRSIIFIPDGKILSIMGIHIISSTVGAWAFFAPYGIGIRESAQSYLLKQLIPFEVAVLVSFLTRIWMIFNDLIMALIIQILEHFKKNKKQPSI
jgi:hypothetical protein